MHMFDLKGLQVMSEQVLSQPLLAKVWSLSVFKNPTKLSSVAHRDQTLGSTCDNHLFDY